MKSTEELKKYRSMSREEVVQELAALTKKYTAESLRVKAGKQENHSSVDKLRKSVARAQTILKENGVNNV